VRALIQYNNDKSKEEDIIIFEHHSILGNQWAEIAKKLPGRTGWNCMMIEKT